jgi:8-oxo-dGTP pyrophosphatase MutT (NUDIX family)
MRSKGIRQQVGALPYRLIENDKLELLLITSRDTGRWLIPKGWPMAGVKDHDAAAQEAWEEAGVVGPVRRKAIGSYRYNKLLPKKAIPCRVTVFPLLVEIFDYAWPEFGERKRAWFSPDEAASLVLEKGLAKILSGFSPSEGEADGDKWSLIVARGDMTVRSGSD